MNEWTEDERVLINSFYQISPSDILTGDYDTDSEFRDQEVSKEPIGMDDTESLLQDKTDPLGLKGTIYDHVHLRGNAEDETLLESILISSRKFKPLVYLRTLHEDTSVEDLHRGVTNLEDEILSQTREFRTVLKNHLDTYVTIKDQIDKLYGDLDLLYTQQHGLGDLGTVVFRLQDRLSQVYHPIFNIRTSQTKIQNQLEFLDKYEFVFGLCSNLRTYIANGQSQRFISELKIGRTMLQDIMTGSQSVWYKSTDTISWSVKKSVFHQISARLEEIAKEYENHIVKNLETNDLDSEMFDSRIHTLYQLNPEYNLVRILTNVKEDIISSQVETIVSASEQSNKELLSLPPAECFPPGLLASIFQDFDMIQHASEFRLVELWSKKYLGFLEFKDQVAQKHMPSLWRFCRQITGLYKIHDQNRLLTIESDVSLLFYDLIRLVTEYIQDIIPSSMVFRTCQSGMVVLYYVSPIVSHIDKTLIHSDIEPPLQDDFVIYLKEARGELVKSCFGMLIKSFPMDLEQISITVVEHKCSPRNTHEMAVLLERLLDQTIDMFDREQREDLLSLVIESYLFGLEKHMFKGENHELDVYVQSLLHLENLETLVLHGGLPTVSWRGDVATKLKDLFRRLRLANQDKLVEIMQNNYLEPMIDNMCSLLVPDFPEKIRADVHRFVFVLNKIHVKLCLNFRQNRSDLVVLGVTDDQMGGQHFGQLVVLLVQRLVRRLYERVGTDPPDTNQYLQLRMEIEFLRHQLGRLLSAQDRELFDRLGAHLRNICPTGDILETTYADRIVPILHKELRRTELLSRTFQPTRP